MKTDISRDFSKRVNSTEIYSATDEGWATVDSATTIADDIGADSPTDHRDADAVESVIDCSDDDGDWAIDGRDVVADSAIVVHDVVADCRQDFVTNDDGDDDADLESENDDVCVWSGDDHSWRVSD